MRRLAIVASHPIQYQAPWFRALARACELDVLFCHRQDARGQGEAGFDRDFEWDVPLTGGYRSQWLDNVSRQPGVGHFGGCDTPGVEAVLAAGRYDACVVSGWYLKSYVQAIRACRRIGVPVLVRGDSQLDGERSALKRAAKYLPYRWFLARIDAHLYVGAANKAYLQHYGVPEHRLFFVPHVVDSTWFAREAARARTSGVRAELAAALGLDSETAVVLFCGKLIDKKRPADLVRAVEELAARGERVRGVFVGSGPLEADLRRLVERTHAPVSFAGFQNQSRMPAWYAMADVLALPSESETWGLVVNEAMSCGVSAVVSDRVGSSRDLVDDLLTGRRFPCGDVRALAEAIAATLRTRRDRPRDVQAALVKTMHAFGLERAVTGVLDAVESVSRGGVAVPVPARTDA